MAELTCIKNGLPAVFMSGPFFGAAAPLCHSTNPTPLDLIWFVCLFLGEDFWAMVMAAKQPSCSRELSCNNVQLT